MSSLETLHSYLGDKVFTFRIEHKRRKKPLVACMGPQSVGKTTLARLIADNIGAVYVPEDFKGLEGSLGALNSLKKIILSGDPTKEQIAQTNSLAVEIETEFLSRKVAQSPLIQRHLEHQAVVWDAVSWNELIYALTYHRLGIIDDSGLHSLIQHFINTHSAMIQPDLIIGLQVSPDVLVARWQTRLAQMEERAFEAPAPTIIFRTMAEFGNNLIDFLASRNFHLLPFNTDQTDYRPIPGNDGVETAIGLVSTQLNDYGFLNNLR